MLRVALVVLLVLTWPARPSAHDIPADVLVQAFVTPSGDRMQVIVRVPLAAMRDVDYPRKGAEYVDLSRADEALRNAATLWIANGLSIYEEGEWLGRPRLAAVRASLPSDRSFEAFDRALAHVSGPPLADDSTLVWNQLLLDVLLEYPIASEQARFSIRPEFARLGLRVVTVLRFLPPGAAERVFQYTGDPGLVRLDPRWHQAARRFVALGFEHILDGIDHLLFLFCLVLPFRRLKPLVVIVTSFTVAHSITLISAATNVAPDRFWFPPLIETLIAASIVWMALENMYFSVARGAPPPLARAAALPESLSSRGVSLRRRWVLTFAFGLVHGFGFSFALRDTLQFAGSHVATSLLAFNVGVELGQLAVLAVLLPALHFAFRYALAERIGIILASALVCHTAWHWMIERGSTLGEYDWTAPQAETVAQALRWTMALVAVGGAVWLVRTTRRRGGDKGRSTKYEVRSTD